MDVSSDSIRPSFLPPTVEELASPAYDVTARKAHQWGMVALVALGFVLGQPWGTVPLALAGGIMLVGRFWWPADLVRQLVWRVLEPRGILRRRDAREDHTTRRVARIIGGLIWLASALLLLNGVAAVAWILSGLIALMVVLDASVDFCVLCFIVAQLAQRGIRIGAAG